MTQYLIFINSFLSVIAFSIFSVEQFESVKVWILIAFAIILIAVNKSIIITLQRGNLLIPIGVIGFCLSAVISTLLSNDWRISLYGNPESPFGLLTTLSLGIIYFVTRESFKSPDNRRYLTFAWILSGTIAATYALVQYIGLDPESWGRTLKTYDHFRPFGTLGHPNFLAGYLVMIFPFALVYAIGNFLFIPSLLIMLTAIALSQSRGAWIAFGVTSLCLSAGLWRLKHKFTSLITFIPLTLVGLIALIYYSNRLTEVADLGPARWEYWLVGLKSFKTHPFFGLGVDTFQTTFEHARTAAYWAIEWAGTPFKAHNDYIQILSTQGLFGLFWIILIAIGVVQAFVDYMGYCQSKDYKLFALCGFTSIVGFAICGISSFAVTATSVLFVTQLALLDRPDPIERINPFWPRYALISALILTQIVFFYALAINSIDWKASLAIVLSVTSLMILALNKNLFSLVWKTNLAFVAIMYLTLFPWLASNYERAGNNLAPFNENPAILLMERGSLLFNSPRPLASIGFAAENIVIHAKDPAVKKANIDLAIRAFNAASALAPLSAIYHYKLAQWITTRVMTDKDPGAAKLDLPWATRELKRAQELEPNNPIFNGKAN